MNNIVQFNDHNIQIIERTNQLWLSSGDIALALGYEKTKSITNLYNNHKEEFDGMSEVIDSVTSNSMSRRQRIFNREGAWLIGMFARTPKAAEFRKWVLKVLGTVVDNTQPEKQVIVSEHTRSLPSGKKRNRFIGKGKNRNRRDCEISTAGGNYPKGEYPRRTAGSYPRGNRPVSLKRRDKRGNFQHLADCGRIAGCQLGGWYQPRGNRAL